MPRTFMQLVLGAMDDFARVKELQLLLKIGVNEADTPSEEACQRITLLLDTYLCQIEPWLEELEIALDRIREQLREPDTEAPSQPR